MIKKKITNKKKKRFNFIENNCSPVQSKVLIRRTNLKETMSMIRFIYLIKKSFSTYFIILSPIKISHAMTKM